MAQEDASGLATGAQKLGYEFEHFFDKIANPNKTIRKPDTSWHVAMVKKANESFRKAPAGKKKTARKRVAHKSG